MSINDRENLEALAECINILAALPSKEARSEVIQGLEFLCGYLMESEDWNRRMVATPSDPDQPIPFSITSLDDFESPVGEESEKL
jgi:hypothetical protein